MPLLDIPAWTASGGQEYSEFGASIAPAGDVNGDGYDDLVVGAPQWSGAEVDQGRASVWLGGPLGLDAAPVWSAEPAFEIDQFGTSVAGAGDVNGDGYDDVLVGAPYFDGDLARTGRVFLYLGNATGLDTTAAWTADGPGVGIGWELGYAVASAGDVNGDGYADILATSRTFSETLLLQGAVFLWLGSPDGPGAIPDWSAEGAWSGATFGVGLAGVGDVDADGFADVVIGAPDNEFGEGFAFLYRGSAAGLGPTAAWSAAGGAGGSLFGASVAAAGDVDGDGYDDVLVGAPGFDGGEVDEGQVSLFRGSAGGLPATPDWVAEGVSGSGFAGSSFGAAVAFAGDVDADGFDDVLVGSPRSEAGAGPGNTKVWLFRGSAAGLSGAPDWCIASDYEAGGLGLVLAGAGDVNGDGWADVAIGRQYTTGTIWEEGIAEVYHGNYTVPGGPDGDGDGYAACADCDDSRAAAHPDADETCNGLDDDCDGRVDTDPVDAPSWYADDDGDGYVDLDEVRIACEAPDGFAAGTAEDCDDSEASIHPGADDAPDDGVDQDCAGGDALGAPAPASARAPDGGCGCATGEGATVAPLLGLVVIAQLRRAKRRGLAERPG